MTLSITLDASSLAALERKLSPELYQAAVGRGFVDVTHQAEGDIKSLTPVVTGNLRRSIRTDVRNATRFPNPETRIGTEAVYAWWIETGSDRRGRVMKSQPGGYRMFRDGAKATGGKVPGIMQAVIREIEEEWSS